MRKNKLEEIFMPKIGRQEQGIQLLFGEINNNVAAETCAWILEANIVPDEEKPKSLVLFINSEGGELPAAFSIIECMRGSAIPVQTVALGNVCSAGLIIFMNGQKGARTITPTCSIMSHNYSTGIVGSHHELLAIQKELNYTHRRIIDTYKRCTGLTEKVICEQLIGNQDNWLTPKEAIEYGMADRISGV